MEPDDLAPPGDDDTWVALSASALPVERVHSWVIRPDTGATVVFTGTARDHAPGRTGVHRLEYEAYAEHAATRMRRVAADIRTRWPAVRRIALLHRTGPLSVGDAAVVVGVSSAHRDDAFEAGRHGIDELKRTVPIWKKESWADGESWGLEAQHVTEVGAS